MRHSVRDWISAKQPGQQSWRHLFLKWKESFKPGFVYFVDKISLDLSDYDR